MTEQEILDSLTSILRDLLGDESIVLSMNTRREDVPGWDSFNYVYFIVATETRFKVKFSVAEVESFANVGAIVARTREILGQRAT